MEYKIETKDEFPERRGRPAIILDMLEKLDDSNMIRINDDGDLQRLRGNIATSANHAGIKIKTRIRGNTLYIVKGD